MTYRASFSHWSDFTFEELADYTFSRIDSPGPATELSADMVLAPMTNVGPAANRIISPLLTAYANQFSYLYNLTYEMGLLRRIEFVKGQDLDNIWGRIYELKRFYGETDDHYRKRLQIYLLQLAGSGTKAAIENIVSVIVDRQNSCRVDTYFPGYCRIYIIDGRARIKARERLTLINQVLPNTLAAGVDYRFYIPYYDLDAHIAIHGPVYTNLPAGVALQDVVKTYFEAHIYVASRSSTTLDADLVLASMPRSLLKAYMAVRGRVDNELEASVALQEIAPSFLDASEALRGVRISPFQAHERLQASNLSELETDLALQAKRVRPVEARMLLEA